MNVLLFVLSVVMIVVIARLSYWLVGDYFAPWNLFAAAWLSMFGVFSLNLIQYIPIELSTWLMFAGASACFMCGTLYGLGLSHRILEFPVLGESYFQERLHEHRLNIVILVLLGVGITGQVLYLRAINQMFGLEILLADPAQFLTYQSRFMEDTFFWGKFLLYVNYLVCALTIFYMSVYPKQRRIQMIVVFLISLVGTVISVKRGPFLIVMLWSGLTYAYTQQAIIGKRIQGRVLTAIALAGILSVSFFVFQGLRLGKTQAASSTVTGFNIPILSNKPIYSSLVSPYIYLTGNIAGFDQYVQVNENRTWGAFSAVPLLKVLDRIFDLQLDLPDEVGAFYDIPFRFNTYTYLDVPYSDWGVIGIILYPLLLGFITTRLYIQMRHRPSLGNVLGCALIGYGLLFSIVANRFMNTQFWEFVLLLIPIAWFVQRRVDLPSSVNSVSRPYGRKHQFQPINPAWQDRD